MVRQGISKAITESNAYQEDLNLFTVAMGQYAKEAQEYAENVGDIMGIDPAKWMRNQGVFNTLLSGFGSVADRSYLMSKNLTQLGYDISSFFNISVEDAMQKLQSGVSGELEPLRRLGYDLSQAKLEQTALTLGIEKSVSAMTQAEKAELRYYAIMTQVTTAQGDMARTLEAPANQLRIFKAQIEMTARSIGNIFIPILMKLLPIAIAIAKAIRKLADAIAKLFGFELSDIDTSGVKNLASGAEDTAAGLDDATSAAKELKKSVMGFDELNILNGNTASGSGSAGVSGGSGFDFELPEYDFIGDAVSKQIDEVTQKLKNALPWILAIGAGLAAWKLGPKLGLDLQKTIGLAVGIFGALTLVQNILDSIVNGVTEENMTGMIFGMTLAVTGLYVALGPVAGGITAIVSGLAVLAVAFSDAEKSGWNFQNQMLAIAGILAAGVGIGILIGSWIPLLIAMIAALLLSITVSTGHIQIAAPYSGSLRQQLGWLAGLIGCNAKFDATGNLVFCWYADNGLTLGWDVQYMDGLELTADGAFTINSLLTGTEENPISVGTGLGITSTNPYMTAEQATVVLAQISGKSLMPCKLKWRGNPAVEAGDSVTVTGRDGKALTVYVMEQRMTIKGGMSADITCYGTEDADYAVESPTQKKVQRQYDDVRKAFQDATSRIIGAKGGYFEITYDDDGFPTGWVIRNTPSVEDDTKMWIMSAGGLGYSSDGGKTVTDIALTDDGKILGSALIIKQDDVDGLSAALSAINGKLTSKITRAEAESEIKQTADALIVRITGLDDDLQLITKSFHVGDDGLVIGETDNPIKLRLDNDTLQFLRDNVAELEITADGVVAKRLTVSTIMIGEVLIQADDNGDVIIA